MPRFKNTKTGKVLDLTDQAMIDHYTKNSDRYVEIKDEPVEQLKQNATVAKKEAPKKKDK